MYKSIHMSKMIQVIDIVIKGYDISAIVSITGNEYPQALANALARALEEEIPIVAIKYIRYNRFITYANQEHIAFRLGQAPIFQDATLRADDSVRVNWHNTTSEVMNITTDDIPGIKFAHRCNIVKLAPTEHITADLFIGSGSGRTNKNYSIFTTVGFKKIDQDKWQFNMRYKRNIDENSIKPVMEFAADIVMNKPEMLRTNKDRLYKLIVFNDLGERVQCTTRR